MLDEATARRAIESVIPNFTAPLHGPTNGGYWRTEPFWISCMEYQLGSWELRFGTPAELADMLNQRTAPVIRHVSFDGRLFGVFNEALFPTGEAMELLVRDLEMRKRARRWKRFAESSCQR